MKSLPVEKKIIFKKKQKNLVLPEKENTLKTIIPST